jgi:hypothetical protein
VADELWTAAQEALAAEPSAMIDAIRAEAKEMVEGYRVLCSICTNTKCSHMKTGLSSVESVFDSES